METLFPTFLVAIGLVVLAFGKRIPVLGAAVGALLGVGLLRLLPGTADSWWIPLLVVGGFAIGGFLLTAVVTVVVNIAAMVLGALGGAAIVLGFLDLFGINNGALDWLFAAIGGGIGLVLAMRFKELALIVLAGLVGGLLVTRGLTEWFPTLEGAWRTLIVLVLAGGGIAFQGGFLGGRKDAAPAQAAPDQTASTAQAAPPVQTAPPEQPASEGGSQLATDNPPTSTSP